MEIIDDGSIHPPIVGVRGWEQYSAPEVEKLLDDLSDVTYVHGALVLHGKALDGEHESDHIMIHVHTGKQLRQHHGSHENRAY